MSNLWFNIALGNIHFQSGPDHWFRVSRNVFTNRPWHELNVFCAFGRPMGAGRD